MRLRIRIFLGVISKSSSSAMNSRHSSRLMRLGVMSLSASSLDEERVFVRCFCLQTFTFISSALGLSPMTMPSYTCVPGPMNSVPRPWAL